MGRRAPGDWQIVAAAVALAAVAEGAVLHTHGFDDGVPDVLRSAGTAAAFIIAGLLARRREPSNQTWALLVLVGFCFLAEDLQSANSRLLYTFGAVFRDASVPALAWLVLAFPSGRLRSTWERAAVVALAVSSVLFAFPGIGLFGDDHCDGCTQSLLKVATSHPVTEILRDIHDGLEIGLVAMIAVVMLDRWRRSSRPARRVLTPFLAVAAVLGLVAALDARAGHGSDLHATLRVISHVATIMVPFAFLLGIVRLELARADVVEAITTLGERASLADLRSAAARALGDPVLRLLRREPDGRLVDEGGADVAAVDPGLASTDLRRGSRSLGVFIHDPALRQDEKLLASAQNVLAEALERQRLALEAEQQEADARRTRQRLVTAAEDERRRLERDIHDGSQSRLISVGLALRRVQAALPAGSEGARELDGAVAELQRAIDELRELARGVRPASLDDGLSPALRQLAARSPLRTDVELAEGRFEAPVETAAYFVASEALTNAAKHARASRATLSTVVRNGSLIIEVRDDGVGGARMEAGSGLTGMATRVDALGGTLTVASPAGQGTAVTAELPYSHD